MTAHKHLKQLVRARMSKTGERYATARRHVVGAHASTNASGPTYAGLVPATTALRLVLAHAGVVDPPRGVPFSEQQLFLLAGGIGAGMFAFRYEKEDVSTFFVAGRHAWHDDEAYLRRACERLGANTVVKESAGAKAADKILDEGLANGRPVIAWVDSASLPHRAMPSWMRGGGYHVVTVLSKDASSGDVTIADLADQPVVVPRADFAAARARIGKQKNRVLWIDGHRPVDSAKAHGAALAACVDGLVKQRMKNFTLDSFATWAGRLEATKGRESWAVMFPRGAHFAAGLRWAYDFIELYGTGGGACRPLFASALREASDQFPALGLAKAAEAYTALADEWSSLADTLLPGSPKPFGDLRAALDTRAEALAAGAPATAIAVTWADVESRQAALGKDFPLDEIACARLRSDLAARVRSIHASETRALELLAARR